MRVAISLAFVLAAITLIAKANETPTPAANASPQAIVESGETFYSDAPLVAPTEPPAAAPSKGAGWSDAWNSDSSDAPNAGIAASPANETSIVTKAPEGKVCVLLKEKSFEIQPGDKPERTANESPAASLVCDHATTTSAPGGAASLQCTNCTLTLPNGITATAAEIGFDFKSNTLTLIGTEEKPVSVKMAGTVSTCPKLEMKVNRKNWGVPGTTAVNQGQVLSTITPMRPQPQSRY